jgi:hypothetical protein
VQRIPQMTYLCMPCGYFWERTSENSVMAKFGWSPVRWVRISLPGTSVNMGKKKGQSCYAPALPSCLLLV